VSETKDERGGETETEKEREKERKGDYRHARCIQCCVTFRRSFRFGFPRVARYASDSLVGSSRPGPATNKNARISADTPLVWLPPDSVFSLRRFHREHIRTDYYEQIGSSANPDGIARQRFHAPSFATLPAVVIRHWAPWQAPIGHAD